nr:MAG TPA: hypothetical protein [Caudoviricetes sp.]
MLDVIYAKILGVLIMGHLGFMTYIVMLRCRIGSLR